MESTIVDRWLEETLAPLTNVTGVYEGLAPVDAPYPFIVYQLQSDDDVVGVGPKARIMADHIYVVRAIAAAEDFNGLSLIAKDIDDVLDGGRGSTAGGVVLSASRVGQYRDTEQHQDHEIRHLGGKYRIMAQGT